MNDRSWNLTMSRRGIRIIPKTKDPMTPLVHHSMERGWSLEGAIPRDAARRESGELTYLVLENQTYVILREDALTGVHYFTIWGPAEAEIAREIRELVNSYTERELIEWWDRAAASDDVDDKVDAVLFLGAGAPSVPDDAINDRLRAALQDPDKDVRNAAVVGAAYADWDVLKPDLEAVAAGDPDGTIRARANVVLANWGRQEQTR